MRTIVKPTVQSVAIVIKDSVGRLLIVKRDESDDSLPGVWGLPAATIREGETAEEAAIRAGRDKLGIVVQVKGFVGDDSLDRGSYVNHLREYEVDIIDGTPSVPQNDLTVSQYADLQFTDDPTMLFDAARQGSLCSRIYLRMIDLRWDNARI
jgi:ADP-ribose pyrophosphatase YjhB (NUDIX family)